MQGTALVQLIYMLPSNKWKYFFFDQTKKEYRKWLLLNHSVFSQNCKPVQRLIPKLAIVSYQNFP